MAEAEHDEPKGVPHLREHRHAPAELGVEEVHDAADLATGEGGVVADAGDPGLPRQVERGSVIPVLVQEAVLEVDPVRDAVERELLDPPEVLQSRRDPVRRADDVVVDDPPGAEHGREQAVVDLVVVVEVLVVRDRDPGGLLEPVDGAGSALLRRVDVGLPVEDAHLVGRRCRCRPPPRSSSSSPAPPLLPPVTARTPPTTAAVPATAPPTISARRPNRRSGGGAVSLGLVTTSCPSSAACTSSTSVVVAPTIAERPRSRYGASGAQPRAIGAPGCSAAESASGSTVATTSVPSLRSTRRRSSEPWKMTWRTEPDTARPSAEPSTTGLSRSGRSITVTGSPGWASVGPRVSTTAPLSRRTRERPSSDRRPASRAAGWPIR